MEMWQDALTIKHTENSIEQTYHISAPEVLYNEQEDVIVRLFALSMVPQYYNGMPLRRLNMQQTADGLWDFTVRWELINWGLQFELTGTQHHITQSKETISKIAAYPKDYSGPTITAADLRGGINVDLHGVHGCEIFVPSGQWSETYEVPVEQVTESYESSIDSLLLSPVNDATFRGRARGEVLFCGCTGNISSVDPRFCTMTWRFRHEKNRTSAGGNALTIGGIYDSSGATLASIDKEGWHYLWIQYKKAIDPVSLSANDVPIGVYVERVFDYGDFSTLNIGTTRTDAAWIDQSDNDDWMASPRSNVALPSGSGF
jgi:hypothetical protein